uniref:Uncharacterized protein n=1 Tax=Zea mays TaxID=4577 RepID=A0A804N180_MAIZE
MEHCYLRQPISRAEAVPERRSRLWQMDALPLPPRAEVLCPQPRRAARIPFAVSVNKAIPRSNWLVLGLPLSRFLSGNPDGAKIANNCCNLQRPGACASNYFVQNGCVQ